jgi:predicted NBD/HSP70 family sugar kinase
MTENFKAEPQKKPPLDLNFEPIALWNRKYSALVRKIGGKELKIALERGDGTISVNKTLVIDGDSESVQLNDRFVERLVKYLLWQKGGFRVMISGDRNLAERISAIYSPTGARAFDHQFMGDKIYGRSFSVDYVPPDEFPEEKELSQPLGRHLDGCRIGFDLGGSDRKCAAVIDGEVVHSEEVVWDPYFHPDPDWHYDEINDSLRRAAEKLPRVDAIGGSSAGVYVNNEVRVASLFRGVSEQDFVSKVRPIFKRLKKAWGDIPFVVVNDGEVTALAGSMSLNDNAILGVAMGTSLAAGYVTPEGNITSWLNELAFVPVDMQPNAHRDEWSGDLGVGAQYFSQQAVGRLVPSAGIGLPASMPLPEKLIRVQQLMEKGDERAALIYQTIGVYFGHNVVQYMDMYALRSVLVLGRVLTGAGGNLILETAREVLKTEYPELRGKIRLVTPGEKEKRLGQAMAAASLPSII